MQQRLDAVAPSRTVAPVLWARGTRHGPSLSSALETVLEAYLTTRRARFPRHGLDHPAGPLFVDVRGPGLSVDQLKYLIERFYIRATLLGHASLETTRRYLDATAEELRQVVRSRHPGRMALREHLRGSPAEQP